MKKCWFNTLQHHCYSLYFLFYISYIFLAGQNVLATCLLYVECIGHSFKRVLATPSVCWQLHRVCWPQLVQATPKSMLATPCVCWFFYLLHMYCRIIGIFLGVKLCYLYFETDIRFGLWILLLLHCLLTCPEIYPVASVFNKFRR